MPATFEPIASVTLSAATASVTFSSIPQTFTDLVLISSVQTQTNNDALDVRFNSDATTSYSSTQIIGEGSTATSYRNSNQSLGRIGNNIPSTTSFATVITNIQNYSNSTTNKTFLSRFNNASSGTGAFASLWRSTSAITSITVYPETLNTLLSSSTFSLYGIRAGA